VLACLQGDKKVRQGKVRFVLPTAIGQVVIRDDIDPELIRQVLLELTAGNAA
jgi:3-dehydroquinate synthase